MAGATLRVFHATTGQLVHELRARQGVTRMNVSGWSAGMYQVVGADSEGKSAQWTLEVVD